MQNYDILKFCINNVINAASRIFFFRFDIEYTLKIFTFVLKNFCYLHNIYIVNIVNAKEVMHFFLNLQS